MSIDNKNLPANIPDGWKFKQLVLLIYNINEVIQLGNGLIGYIMQMYSQVKTGGGNGGKKHRNRWTDKKLDEKFDNIDKRFEAIDKRFDKIEGMLVNLTNLVTNLANKLDKVIELNNLKTE